MRDLLLSKRPKRAILAANRSESGECRFKALGGQMFHVYVSAYPGSGIRGALIGVDVPSLPGTAPRTARVLVDAGGFGTGQLDLSSMDDTVSMVLSVTLGRNTSNIYAANVSRDGELHVLGVSPNLFLGKIRHAAGQTVACTLRCTPTSEPVTGPGCIDCPNATPKYEVCCD